MTTRLQPSTSRFSRVLVFAAAVVITSSLFAGVAIGLTSTDELAVALAQATARA